MTCISELFCMKAVVYHMVKIIFKRPSFSVPAVHYKNSGVEGRTRRLSSFLSGLCVK